MTVMERRGPEGGCAHNHEDVRVIIENVRAIIDNVHTIIDNVHTIIGKSDLGKP